MKKIFLTILFFCGIASFCFATTYEKQQKNNVLVDTISGGDISGQTFTPTTTHSTYGIKVFLRNNSKNILSAFLCNYDITGGTPNPDFRCYRSPYSRALAIGTIYASSVVSGLVGNEYHILFNNLKENLATNTEYALIFDFSSATTGTNLALYGGDNNPYASGTFIYSNNAGATWNTSNDDLYFNVLGEKNPTTTEDMCVCTTTLNYIQNASTGAGFWLDSSISFGDFLIATFLLGILSLLTIQFIFKLEIPQRINFKKL